VTGATDEVRATGSPYDFNRARKDLVAAVGKQEILKLHRKKPWLDWLCVIATFALFGGLAWYLGQRRYQYTMTWWIAFLAQGFVIMSFGYMMHDLFMHRRVGGAFVSYILGNVTSWLSFNRFTEYRHVHGDHHRFAGTDPDEEYKQDLDTRWKRLLFCTPVGYLLAVHRLLRRKHPEVYPAPEGSFTVPKDKPSERRRHVGERLVQAAFLVLLILVGLKFRTIRYGYLLPLAFALPLANVVRIILEHSETNPRNNLHCATFYRTGFLTRFLFFWDAGDCHLVHHIFPAIPFYNMGKAVDAMRAPLIAQGVRERRSLPLLLWCYFVRCEPHRTLWAR